MNDVLAHILNIHMPHVVQNFLLTEKMQLFSISILISYKILLLSLTLLSIPSLIPIQCCQHLYPTNFLPLLTEEQLHDCISATQTLILPYSGIAELSLFDPHFIIFVDGTYFCTLVGSLQVGYAITDF